MRAVFQAIKRSWFKHFVTQLSATFILTITYAVALFVVLSTTNIKNIFNIWGKVNEATIYLQNDASASNRSELEAYLSSHGLVGKYIYESSDQSALSFKNKFKGMSSQSVDPKNISQFFPALYKVQFKDSHIYEEDQAILDGFSATIAQKFTYVKNVSYGKAWLRKYRKIINGLESVSWVIAFTILLASLFVSSNVIKTILFSKKEEIEILEFVGAGPVWIYGPHIVNIVALSIISFFCAVASVYGIFKVSHFQFSQMISEVILSELQFISVGSILLYFSLIMLGVFSYTLLSVSSLLPKNKKNISGANI